MNYEDLKKRTKDFAHRCVKLALNLPNNALGNNIRRQLIRSATSAAANYRAACLAISRASFISKLSISLEETDESAFWIEFAIDEKLIDKVSVEPLLKEAEELTSILLKSRMTARKNNRNKGMRKKDDEAD